MTDRRHPLRGLTPDEMKHAAAVLKKTLQQNAGGSTDNIRFQHITLDEPPKALLLPYLDAESAGVEPLKRPWVPRCARITWSHVHERQDCETVVSLDTEAEVTHIDHQAPQHNGLDRDEVIAATIAILTDPAVVAEIKKFQLPENVAVQCDTWPFGTDLSSKEDDPKLIQTILYARAPHNHLESNQYSFPIPISPVYDPFLKRVIRIDTVATGGKEDGLKHNTVAPEVALKHLVENEYHSDLQKGNLRKDIKPLLIVQPEGVSFTVEDETKISWQKWTFRVGFNWREGMTIHDVRYDGRKLFYRLSMSEMTVPYGDPRSPHHRRQAFDLGDAGAGITANNLSLGCDCLGTIQYFDGCLSDSAGEPYKAPNVICLHEQDNGIGWKHTNPRTDVAAITRARILVVQSIITVGNYEYIFAWHFTQSGAIEFETHATGILATSLIDKGKTSFWGNVVSPGILAANHQHLFCLRIDPMIDGLENTVIQEDTVAIPYSRQENPNGNAWKVVKTPVESSGFADAAPEKNRVFKVVNEKKINAISGSPVGFKVVAQATQLLIADQCSTVRRRARFAEHHLWVTKYRDGELYAGGHKTNQSHDETGGVFDAASRSENVRNTDVVVWQTYGMTHNPRVEDYPVMPVEILTVALKPVDFFEKNPALDVPPSTQSINKSVLVGQADQS
ncbi:uncharacterized protein A1O5_00764 [Cladophialophora psammophila CBS 110553]|uniref:Amine oxidase n=1 Tax=Cladophialophora psammophila CBS 110553 TaxID=1182543 RepID=W9XH33_9EURO|nr:uncharacterized protein A1O5_00764 [Cladophialophora psammophila CBS 110553]EXJ76256.1 hypothetical protein A1O5_00764 [Cladophialophora psammophila CBS 110553]